MISLRARGKLKHVALVGFWTIAPRAMLRLLPGTSERFGPPRRWSTVADHCARTGDRWQTVLPAATTRLPELFHYHAAGKSDTELVDPICRWSEKGVAFLRDARTMHTDGWPVVQGDRFLGEFCSNGNHAQSAVYRIFRSEPPRRLTGSTLNLLSEYSDINFWHWMMDSVSRIHLCRAVGLGWRDIDHILLPRFSSETTRQILRRLELPEEKCVHPSRLSQFRCDLLIQPSLPGNGRIVPDWAVGFHRALFEPSTPEPGTRLYLPRRAKRRPSNETELEAVLARNGFEVADTGDFARLRRQLAGAEHIVGVHGAALTNLIYARPGARFLELLPSSHAWRYYRSICAAVGVDYGAVVGLSEQDRLHPYAPLPAADFHIPIQEFERALSALLQTTRRPAAP